MLSTALLMALNHSTLASHLHVVFSTVGLSTRVCSLVAAPQRLHDPSFVVDRSCEMNEHRTHDMGPIFALVEAALVFRFSYVPGAKRHASQMQWTQFSL